MPRLRLPLLLLCLVPAWSPAADAPAPVCGQPGVEPVFEPSAGRPLTRNEARDLASLFRRVDGRWRGTLVEQVCMLNGSARTHRFDVELDLTRSGDDLRLAGEYVRRPGGGARPFRRRLLVTPDGLRVDQPSRVGEVELLSAGRDAVSYVQHFRTVHRIDQGSPDQLPTPVAGATRLAAPPAREVAAVAGSDNLVTGEPPDGTPAAEPERRSLIRSERFTLRASGAGLVLVQEHYTQGVYAGTMRWELRRR